FIVSIGMHEYVERSMIQRKPSDDVGELGRREPDLVAPSWMGSHFSFVKAAYLNPVAKLCGRCFAKFPGGIAAGRIEIDMRMPAGDTRNIEIFHSRLLGSRAHFRQFGFNSISHPCSAGRTNGKGRPKAAPS